MPQDSLLARLADGRTKAEEIVEDVLEGPRLLDAVFAGISSSKLPRVKFGCSKSLVLLSEKDPQLLYEKIDSIVALLQSENRILKWSAIAILGNLAAVDPGRRVRGLLKTFYGFLAGGELITANHTIAALGKMGRAFPGERGRIVSRLIGIERASFDTDECRNIAIGKAIAAIEVLADPAHPGESVLEFARRQTGNARQATAKKARALARKYGSGIAGLLNR